MRYNGERNGLRDQCALSAKYPSGGVREYWIVDWRESTIQVFRRHQAILELAATLTRDDDLS
ncbi:MAG TPA: Uma2 family endonuclease, partial [Chloroflexota bacterium]|nr:Uma2 family endonuclease [Chloroflexota bacterium]